MIFHEFVALCICFLAAVFLGLHQALEEIRYVKLGALLKMGDVVMPMRLLRPKRPRVAPERLPSISVSAQLARQAKGPTRLSARRRRHICGNAASPIWVTIRDSEACALVLVLREKRLVRVLGGC
jgi:hypothetical protein